MKTKSLPFYKVIYRTIHYGYKKLTVYFWLYIITCVVLAIFNFLSIKVLQELFDSVSSAFSNGEWNQVTLIIIVSGIIFVIFRIMNGIKEYFNKIYFMTFMGKILKDMNAKAGRLRLLEFESLKLYDKINMAIGGVNYAIRSTIDLINGVIYYTIFFLSIAIYFYTIKPVLLVLCVLIFLPQLFSQYIKGSKMYKLQERIVKYERQSDYYRKCLVDKQYFKETKTLGAVGYFMECYRNKIEESNKERWKVILKTTIISCILTSFTYIGYVVSFILLTHFLLDGSLSIGHFAAIYYSMSRLMDTMKEMIELFGTVYEKASLAGKLYDFLELPESNGNDKEIDSIQNIRLEDVCFQYPYTDKNALNHVSLEIEKGSHVAIVGLNGSGKTTLVKILMGLFKPSQGKVYMNHEDTSMWNTNSYNSKISAVFQNYGKYNLTLEENIRLSDVNLKADDDYLRDKMEEAGFNYQKESIAGQLDIMLGREFNGIDLSGGEWQRLAIARGIYRISDFIVLDEPTAAIDPIEEANVYKRFDEISKDKTVLVVTHRLGSVKSADRIIVLNAGEIIEDGSHEELLKQKGFYSNMFLAQAEWYQRENAGQ